MNNFNNYENEIFENTADLVVGVNANNCTFLNCANTTFERCNFRNCTFAENTRFYKSNVIKCNGVCGSIFEQSNESYEEEVFE